ncbi:MAG TPA: hypothetical protein VFE68_03765 [Vicinamibacteria bacterium]|nr:hypothetical protein [Vicinamibacteria bacterium]
MKLWDVMESPVQDVGDLRRRTTILAVIHVVLTTACLALLALLVLRIKLLVTLAQRSNVETLLLLFFAAFVTVLLITTGSSTLGAITLLGLRVLPADRRQRWIQAHAVAPRREERTLALLNLGVAGPDGVLELSLEDGFGRLGRLRVQGVELQLEDAPDAIAGPVFELATAVLSDVAKRDPHGSPLGIVLWANVDRSEAEVYRSQAHAFGRLAQALGKGPLWPTAVVDDEGMARLRAVFDEATPYLREAALMRDIDYAAEFSIPLVPEPLAFVQIHRSESRADPVASLGCAALMVLAALIAVVWVVLFPPWVPSK